MTIKDRVALTSAPSGEELCERHLNAIELASLFKIVLKTFSWRDLRFTAKELRNPSLPWGILKSRGC
jgi:hypothetical protein